MTDALRQGLQSGKPRQRPETVIQTPLPEALEFRRRLPFIAWGIVLISVLVLVTSC